MTMTNDGEKILQAVLDPRWKVGLVQLDKTQHIFLTLQHPEHVNLTWLLPRDQAKMLGENLMRLAA